jgi:hypothetical protein
MSKAVIMAGQTADAAGAADVGRAFVAILCSLATAALVGRTLAPGGEASYNPQCPVENVRNLKYFFSNLAEICLRGTR